MSKKRGQITLFLIIGIVVLVSASLVFFLRTERTESVFEEAEPIIAEIPKMAEPVGNFVDECLEQTATKGLTLLGEQGGYISLEDTDLDSTLNDPTSSDYVELAPNINVPYWAYMKSDNENINTCQFHSNMPPLYRGITTQYDVSTSIEEQLDEYIGINLPLCLNEFKVLENQGFTVKSGEITVKTTVAENDIRFYMIYPMEITKESTVEVSEFYVKVPLRLKQIYNLALDLANIELEQQLLGRQLANLIASFEGVDKNRLPPTAESEFKKGIGTIWTRTEVRDMFSELLTAYVPAIQVEGAINFKQVDVGDVPYKDAVQKIYNDNVIMAEYLNHSVPSGIGVNFAYLPSWPLYFDVDSDGELIMPESAMASFIPIIGIQRYAAVYDLSYPVWVRIWQPKSTKFPKGYNFNIMLEANFRNNEPYYCGKDLLFYAPGGELGSLLSSPNQRISANVTVKVIDGGTSRGLANADIGFACAGDSFIIGRTNAKGIFTSPFPLCPAGTIGATKFTDASEYVSDYTAIETVLDRPQHVELTLEPYYDLELDVKKVNMGVVNNQWITGSVTPLGPTDEVIITFKRQKDTPDQDSHTAFAQFGGEASEELQIVWNDDNTYDYVFEEGETFGRQQIRLAPGTYDIEATLFKHEYVLIPSRTDEVGSWWYSQKITYPEAELDDPHPWGGVELNNVRIKSFDLMRGKMTAYVLSYPTPSRIEHIEWMNSYSDHSDPLKGLLLPRYK